MFTITLTLEQLAQFADQYMPNVRKDILQAFQNAIQAARNFADSPALWEKVGGDLAITGRAIECFDISMNAKMVDIIEILDKELPQPSSSLPVYTKEAYIKCRNEITDNQTLGQFISKIDSLKNKKSLSEEEKKQLTSVQEQNTHYTSLLIHLKLALIKDKLSKLGITDDVTQNFIILSNVQTDLIPEVSVLVRAGSPFNFIMGKLQLPIKLGETGGEEKSESDKKEKPEEDGKGKQKEQMSEKQSGPLKYSLQYDPKRNCTSRATEIIVTNQTPWGGFRNTEGPYGFRMDTYPMTAPAPTSPASLSSSTAQQIEVVPTTAASTDFNPQITFTITLPDSVTLAADALFDVKKTMLKALSQADLSFFNFLEVLDSEAVRTEIEKLPREILPNTPDGTINALISSRVSRVLNEVPNNPNITVLLDAYASTQQGTSSALTEYLEQLIYLTCCSDIFDSRGKVRLQIIEKFQPFYGQLNEAQQKIFKDSLVGAYFMHVSLMMAHSQGFQDKTRAEEDELERRRNEIIDIHIIRDSKDWYEQHIGALKGSVLDRELIQVRKNIYTMSGVQREFEQAEVATTERGPTTKMYQRLDKTKIDNVFVFVREKQGAALGLLQGEVAKVQASISSIRTEDGAEAQASNEALRRATLVKIDSLLGLIGEHTKLVQSLGDPQGVNELMALKGQLIHEKNLLDDIAQIPVLNRVLSSEGEAIIEDSGFGGGAFLHAASQKIVKPDNNTVLKAVRGAAALDVVNAVRGEGKTNNTLRLLRNGNLMKRLVGGSQNEAANIKSLVETVAKLYENMCVERARIAPSAKAAAEAAAAPSTSAASPPSQPSQAITEQARHLTQVAEDLKEALKRFASTRWRPFGINFGKRMDEAQIDALNSLAESIDSADMKMATTQLNQVREIFALSRPAAQEVARSTVIVSAAVAVNVINPPPATIQSGGTDTAEIVKIVGGMNGSSDHSEHILPPASVNKSQPPAAIIDSTPPNTTSSTTTKQQQQPQQPILVP